MKENDEARGRAVLPLGERRTSRDAADLYWLAFLLTGQSDLSIEIAADSVVSQDEGHPFFTGWMRAWSRRIVISKALATIREALAESARQTEVAGADRAGAPLRGWSLPADTSKAQIEEALLAIDVFPRAAVVLSILEGVRIADAATLLDRDAALVKKGLAIGLGQLTANLAGTKRRVLPRLCFAWAPA
jgi:DNA-directed RNA polymerase specialized sigma24 family protein